jgi:predicted acetyltransferase
MTLEISPAALEDKPLISRMMQLYLYDFSEMTGFDLDPQGCFLYPYLDHYWSEPNRYPFVIRFDGKLAGFVLVNQHTHIPGNEWSIAEFFVLRKYRRKGIGKRVAFDIFNRFHGKWEIYQIPENKTAQVFWREVIDEYTQGNYTVKDHDAEGNPGVIQCFEN